jgi:hypothetical protein
MLFLLLAALCAHGGELRAQWIPSVNPGERVRVTAPDLRRQVGTVVAVRADTLVFQARGAERPVPLSIPDVSRLQVARGTQSPIRGALIGSGVGALAGYGIAAALVAGEECDASDCLGPREIAAFFAWAGATVTGAIGGALIAANTERWVSVPLASLAPAGAVTRPGGVPRGALVRVRAPGARPVVARVVGVRGDSLVLREPGSRGETAVALSGVRTLEIGAGRDRTASTLRGAAIGSVVGALAIGTLGYVAAKNDPYQTDPPSTNALWMGGFFGVPIGAGIGGLAGYAIGTERWVLLPPLAGVTVAPGREGGVALGLTLPAR